MWQANAPIGQDYNQPDPVVQPEQERQAQLYQQAMGDLAAKQNKEGQRGSRNYQKKSDGNPLSGLMGMFGGGSNGNSTTMAGEDFGKFGNIA
jgi:hypothetical protein